MIDFAKLYYGVFVEGKKGIVDIWTTIRGAFKRKKIYSNCITEIPQNLILTIENNILTSKAGNIIVRTGGSSYETTTMTEDKTQSYENASDGVYIVFPANSNGSMGVLRKVESVGSGDTLPADGTNYSIFYINNTMYLWHSDTQEWREWGVGLPICMIEVSNGVASFAKDSKGRDMIFNGFCYIGHHIVSYPDVNSFIGNGFDDELKLDSLEVSTNSLQIIEMNTNNNHIILRINGNIERVRGYEEVDAYNDIVPVAYHTYYVKNENLVYRCSSDLSLNIYKSVNMIEFNYDGSTVTKFDIRQPYEGAAEQTIYEKGIETE